MKSQKCSSFWQVQIAQLVVLIPLGVSLWGWNSEIGSSFVGGSLICFIPHLYFTAMATSRLLHRSAFDMGRQFYRAETGKFVLNLLAFAGFFVWQPDAIAWVVFLGYFIMWLVQVWWTARLTAR